MEHSAILLGMHVIMLVQYSFSYVLMLCQCDSHILRKVALVHRLAQFVEAMCRGFVLAAAAPSLCHVSLPLLLNLFPVMSSNCSIN